MDIDKHIKGYLALAAVVSVTYGAWQVFDRYNADAVELKQLEKEIAVTQRDAVVTAIAIRRDSAAKALEMNARARAHYEELRKDGELRDAEENRLLYLEQTVPEQQNEVEKLDDRLTALESKE